MKSLAALLSLAVLAPYAAAADGSGTQAPTQSPSTQSPGTQSPGTQSPSTPGTRPPSNTSSPDGQTPSMENPGSTQSPNPTPGTEFPSQQNPTAPNQTGPQAQRSRQQVLNDVRASVIQMPPAGQAGSTTGTQPMPIQDLRVFRRNGKIVLTGTVRSQAEKDAAGTRASQRAGGQEILNQLQVK